MCPMAEAHYHSNDQDEILEKLHWEKGCWPHLWDHCLPRGGPGGHCWCPADWVPLRTSFKSTQRAGCATTHRHVSCTRTCLPAKVGPSGSDVPTPPEKESSGTTKCTMALDPLGGLRCTTCHVALDPASLWGGLPRRVGSPVGHGPQARRKA
jgi:hypothetical protein